MFSHFELPNSKDFGTQYRDENVLERMIELNLKTMKVGNKATPIPNNPET